MIPYEKAGNRLKMMNVLDGLETMGLDAVGPGEGQSAAGQTIVHLVWSRLGLVSDIACIRKLTASL
jgi:hypothetical protein